MHSISPYFHENIQDLNLLLSIVRALASRNSNFTLFYYPKKPFYYYTIPFYNTSNIPNFYFSILLIKIIYLHNKIIYPKTQIKTKTQITTCYHHHHEQPSTYQPIIDPKPINPSTTTAPIKKTQPQHQKNPPRHQGKKPNHHQANPPQHRPTTTKKNPQKNHHRSCCCWSRNPSTMAAKPPCQQTEKREMERK